MSQLHQEALRRQHVVDKRNVNDLSWLVSTNSQLRASVLFEMNYQKIISRFGGTKYMTYFRPEVTAILRLLLVLLRLFCK